LPAEARPIASLQKRIGNLQKINYFASNGIQKLIELEAFSSADKMVEHCRPETSVIGVRPNAARRAAAWFMPIFQVILSTRSRRTQASTFSRH